jgi:hypothetical protein
MLNETEQRIYNQYLRAMAEKYQRPYKARKDFSKMREKDVLQIQKLRMFFEQYKDVNPFQFFKAGFKYELSTYPTLEYFTTLRATRVYAKHMREKYNEDVDNIESIKDFKDGILFIYGFIQEKDITLAEYKTCVNEHGVPWVIIHLKQQNISFYHIHCLEIAIDIFPYDYREMITDEFEKVWEDTKEQYLRSKEMREIGTRFNKFSQRLIKAGKKA